MTQGRREDKCPSIHVNTASYTLLVAGKKKNTGEEWDVLEFSSLTELKKYRKSGDAANLLI